MKIRNYKFDGIVLVYCLIVSAVMLFFCTSSSPFYAINASPDANAFFTVGKAMANGATIYKDIFEQKGPLLYLIFAIAYKISNTSFTGVYIIEVLAIAVSLFYAHKISSLYLNRNVSFIIIPVFCATIVNSLCYYYGAILEELLIPMLMVSFYYLAIYFKNSETTEFKWYIYFINGFLAGCVTMMKFIDIGFWFGWMAMIALHTLFNRKQPGKAVKNSLIFLGGMLAAFLPWVIYFLAKGGLKDFIEAYFIINITKYSKASSSILSTVKTMIYNFVFYVFRRMPITVGITALGGVLSLIVGKLSDGKVFSRFAIPVVYGCGVVFIYLGGIALSYYYLAFTTFSIFAFISVGMLLGKIKNKKLVKPIFATACAISIATACLTTAKFNTSVAMAKRNKEDTFQYKISDYINKNSTDADMLCYDSLDTGVYLFNNYIPKFKYFERQNINYKKFPENFDEMNRYIDKHEVEFVAVRTYKDLEEIYKDNATLESDYTIVLKGVDVLADDCKRNGTLKLDYYLFQLNSTIKN